MNIWDMQKEKKEETAKGHLNTLLEVIKGCDKGKGALYRDVSAEFTKRGIEKLELEDTFEMALDDGLIYEPVLGRVKLI